MKRIVLVSSLFVVLLAIVAAAQGGLTPFGNGHGAFRGNTWVPSTFQMIFGDNATTDVSLQKNGSNVLGISGNVGGQGSTANTTTSPAAPFAWGTVSLSGGTTTVTFSKAFANAPVCIASDQTGANAVKSAPTATTDVLTGTTTDSIAWACFGNPH